MTQNSYPSNVLWMLFAPKKTDIHRWTNSPWTTFYMLCFDSWGFRMHLWGHRVYMEVKLQGKKKLRQHLSIHSLVGLPAKSCPQVVREGEEIWEQDTAAAWLCRLWSNCVQLRVQGPVLNTISPVLKQELWIYWVDSIYEAIYIWYTCLPRVWQLIGALPQKNFNAWMFHSG